MASEKGAVTTGLESDSQSTRRRNVPATSSNGGFVNRVEVDDKKTQIKKVSLWLLYNKLLLPPNGANVSLFNRKSKRYWSS